MAEAYKRRQLLLRREDGSPGGFIRIEQVGARCTVEVRALGIPGEARVMLLRPGEDAPRALGTAKKGAGSFPGWAEELEGYAQAALLRGDKLVLVGGEGVDFEQMRKRILRARRPERAAAPSAEATHSIGAQARAPVDAPPQTDVPEAAAPPRPLPPTPPRAGSGGWKFTSHFIPGAPERITGRLMRDGRIAATLDGVAGVYAPEPPPGLTGFTWDGGYWLRVQATGG